MMLTTRSGTAAVPLAAEPVQRRRVLALLGAAACSAALRPAVAETAAAPKVAWIIGNTRYSGAPLANAGNDARLVAAAVRELGFNVTLQLDASHAAMLETARSWLAAAAAASVRMVYFAGHGAQYRGRNFLLPVDARLRSEDDLPASAFSVNDLVDRLSRFEAGVNVVVLDACRSIAALSSPPGLRMRGPSAAFGLPGLSPTLTPRGTIVAYSTSPGAVAADNPQAANSTYTRHLVAQLRTPGLPIEAVFKRTRAAVLQESNGTQVPWESSSLISEFCFAPSAAGVCSASGEPVRPSLAGKAHSTVG